MNELATMLQESVSRLFEDLAGPETLEAAEGGTWPAALWKALEETAVTQTLVPESAGGVGASWREAEVVLRAAGRYVAPVPLAEGLVAAWLCARDGLEVPPGILSLAPHAELRRDGERISGALKRVPWGAQAAAVLAEVEGRLVLLDSSAAEVSSGNNLAKEPRDTLRFLAVAPLALGSQDRAGAVQRFGALARACQIAGALELLVAESVQFANDRVQFGRPIGKFQAIQHQLAVLASETAAARAAAGSACLVADGPDPAFEIAVAKVRCGEAAGQGARIAHAVHGAIGFTYEHALHFATRRLWSWRSEFGAESHWSDVLGGEALARGADQLWDYVSAR
jgi:acyl-CoA dehydrogenase